MTSKERLAAAHALEKPDRPPIAMNWGYAPVASLTGYDKVELALSDLDTLLDTDLKVFDDYGGWDGVEGPVPITPDMFRKIGLTVAVPTPDRPETQIFEQENMRYEDYDIIADIGWEAFARDVLTPRVHGWDPTHYDDLSAQTQTNLDRAVAEYERRGAEIMYSAWDFHPFFLFSLARSMLKFTEDLYYRPAKLHRALQRGTDDFIRKNIAAAKKYETACASIVEERAGGYFYPLSVNEEFWWPYTRQIVDALWSEGIVSVFHLDSPWDKNLHLWKQMPKGSCSIQLDGTTDFFRAKEMLRGHVSLNGDVGATLFCLGTPNEVEAYVKKLIDEVGGDGGFILSSGCTLPGAVRPENFRAFLETGRSYQGK